MRMLLHLLLWSAAKTQIDEEGEEVKQHLPDHWIKRLHAYLKRKGLKRKHLECQDFPMDTTLVLLGEDGTTLLFRYAFALQDKKRDEVCVFSEHCGYHVFHGFKVMEVPFS